MSFISSRPKGALTFLAFALLPFAANAQISDGKSSASDCSTLATHAERDDCAKLHAQYYTIYLHNVANEDEASQIMTAVRNTSDPTVRGYVLSSRNAIALDTYPAEYTRIEALVRSLDRPHKAYRLAYTITELDGEKTVSTQHIAMVAVLGQHTSIKEGDKIPLATGSSGGGNTQFTYIDVGMNFDATIEEQGDGVTLKSKVEQSSVGPTNTIAGVQEPVIRQTVLENTAILTLGKPLMLGSIDVPTTTRRFDIAVVLESIK